MAALLVGSVLAACGDDDGGSEGLSAEEARAAVDSALLDRDDLGDGWRATGTVAPDEESDPPDVIEACAGASVLRTLDAGELAASERRDFRRRGEALFESTRVSVRTLAFDDDGAIDRLLALVDEKGFSECLAGRFESLINDSDQPSQLALTVGSVERDDHYLALDGVRSAQLSIPFDASAGRFTFDAELDLVVVSRGQLASLLVTIEVRGRVDGEDVARWAGLLADRQRIAQT
jgi:hypothetical protein